MPNHHQIRCILDAFLTQTADALNAQTLGLLGECACALPLPLPQALYVRRVHCFVSVKAQRAAHQARYPAICELMLAIAVGMPVTRHPPHRSVRAQLRHTAPTSGI